MTKSNSTLRQQERMFALTRLILCSFTFKQYAFPHLILLLVYLKTIDNNQFQKIERNELSLQGLNDLLDETIFAGNDDFRGLRVVYFKALLLWFYNNNESKLPNHRIELFTRDNEGNLTTPVISKHKLSNDFLAGYFENVEKLRYSDLTLSYLIKRINLTEPITIQ